MRQFYNFIKKEFYHVLRDPKSLLMLFGVPIAQIVLFGFALTNEIKNSSIVIVDNAMDNASQQLIYEIKASKYFKVSQIAMNPDQIDVAFKKGTVKLALVIPSGFDNDLQHLHKSQLQIIADASDPNTATTLTNYMTTIIRDYQGKMLQASGTPYNILTQQRMLYNPELAGAPNFVPGVVAMVLLLICVLMTSVSIVREKEMGTLEVLLVSPFNPFMVVFSKMVPYIVVSLINLTIILILSVYLLDLPLKGNLLLLYGESLIFITCALSLGLLISTMTDTQQTAMNTSFLLTMLPTMLLSGYLFPIENMPLFLRIISNIVPAKWFYIIIKSIMLKGLGFSYIWKESLILAGMTVLFMGISLRNFKIRLQ
jgi:ABC-2 type transport system permease protein